VLQFRRICARLEALKVQCAVLVTCCAVQLHSDLVLRFPTRGRTDRPGALCVSFPSSWRQNVQKFWYRALCLVLGAFFRFQGLLCFWDLQEAAVVLLFRSCVSILSRFDLVGGIWQFYNAGQFGQIGPWICFFGVPAFVFLGNRERCISYLFQLCSLLLISNLHHEDLNSTSQPGSLSLIDF
jgi:hypothetical protein